MIRVDGGNPELGKEQNQAEWWEGLHGGAFYQSPTLLTCLFGLVNQFHIVYNYKSQIYRVYGLINFGVKKIQVH